MELGRTESEKLFWGMLTIEKHQLYSYHWLTELQKRHPKNKKPEENASGDLRRLQSNEA